MSRRSESKQEAATLRVATYNIHKCRGLDGRVRPERVIDVLREVNADIVALQEVVCIEGKCAQEHQGQYIAEQLGYYAELRSEEHTSELQSRRDLVCRLLL